MSIYKQIFATASIFAIAAALVITPSVSAGTTGVEISGYVNSTTTDSLCLRQLGTTQPATLVVSGAYPTSGSNTLSATLPVTPTVSGTSYEVFKVPGTASNSCTVLTAVAPVTFKVFTNHTTLLTYNGTVGSYTVRDQLAGVSSTNGSNVINFCIGKTDAVTVTVTDLDTDNITTAPTLTGTDLIISAPTINGSTVTYTVQPTLTGSQTLGTKATVNFALAASNYQYALGTVDSSIYATPVTSITFNVGNSCTVSTPVVSSSSMMSSSSSAAAVATPVASSSAKAVVSVEAPEMSSGKGTSTVRTGGAY
jgi:hypothetical protein